ncbi:hypothetical protein AVEN_118573-1 [Araneus ventricosus]|uniref:HAT C-terminal dimerisation domain-containing protein n=1 Tax=Araneus ventricosus TaxID=182803 RepID=A0A4Y2AYK4_ARAVE|nr:hypothetical protein AVEN_118573-1 [Araneus ventricosus]
MIKVKTMNGLLINNIVIVSSCLANRDHAFCLPGTSAPVERVFSLMNNAWTDDRGLMEESTVKDLMTCKINVGLACENFYNKIKNKKDFLKKSPSQ